jgi:2-deoxy-D-gluconate 3-dehydrogenase
VIVTGAGRGLGRGIAGAIARAGGEVIGVSRSIFQLEETAAGIGAGRFRSLPADVSRLEDLGGLVADAWSHGPVHGIVHGAGIQLRKPALEVSPEDWRSVQAVHVEAPFFLSTALARRQLEEGLPGSHVFVGSLANSIGLRNVAPYVAAKSALMGVVRTLALEWAETGIRVNAVGPGYFLTDLTRELLSDPEQHARVLSRIPMSRLGTPEDLGGAFVFLLADASSYMTGQLVNVDGGWLAG